VIAFGPAVHALPHAPQFVRVLSGVSQPSAAVMLQSPNPALHIAIVHTPPVHEDVPFMTVQARRHAPQCEVLVCVSVSQPFIGLPSQSLHPCSHVAMVHCPLTHPAVAWASSHRWPQAPQWFGSVIVNVHASSHKMPASHMGGGGPASASIVDTVPSVIDAPSRNRTSA
jgi:hypothetical protein